MKAAQQQQSRKGENKRSEVPETNESCKLWEVVQSARPNDKWPKALFAAGGLRLARPCTALRLIGCFRHGAAVMFTQSLASKGNSWLVIDRSWARSRPRSHSRPITDSHEHWRKVRARAMVNSRQRALALRTGGTVDDDDCWNR